MKPSDRRGDILHPSEMAKADWCPRASAYRLSNTPTSDPVNPIDFVLQNIFDEGHTIHAKWQGRLWDMGRLWGRFSCLSCGRRWKDTAPPECPHCGALRALLRYEEVPLSAEPTYRVAGFEDGADKVLNALVEVKSIGLGSLRVEDPALLSRYTVETLQGKKVYDLDALWRGLSSPLPTHIRQTQIYLHIANLIGLPFDRVIFLYEFKANQQVKEFVVKYNPRWSEEIFASAQKVAQAVDGGTTLPRPVGFRLDRKPCTTCPYKTMCWRNNEQDRDPATKATGVVVGGRERRVRHEQAAAGEGAAPRQAGRGWGAVAAIRPNRPGGLGTDEPVREDEPLGGVPWSQGSSLRGR